MLKTLLLGAATLTLISAPLSGLADSRHNSPGAPAYKGAPRTPAEKARVEASVARGIAHDARNMAKRAHRKAKRAIKASARAETKSLDARDRANHR